MKALESRSQLLDAALASADEANRRWEDCRQLVDQLRIENAALRTLIAQLQGGAPHPHGLPQPPPPPPPASSALPGLSVRQLPHFPSIDEAVGASSTTPQGLAAREVWGWFAEHLDALLDSVRGWRFDQFEMHVRTFWGSLGGGHREVVHAPAVAGLMAKADAIVYDVSPAFRFSVLPLSLARSPSDLLRMHPS